jgi:dCTP deaminase
MTFWSSQTLEQKLQKLITPCDPSKIKEASYELRIGSEIYVSKDYHDNNSQHTKRFLAENEPFTIPPGQFAFLLTEECVSVPNDAIAFISMKASSKYKGLVNISGFHVDPGYKGKLLFSVHNAGPSTIHLQRGKPIFLIWYANLDQEDSNPRNKEGLTEIPSQVLNELSTDTIYSMQTLTTRMSKVENEYSTIKLWAFIMKSVGIALLAVVPTVVLYLWDYKSTVDEHNKKIDQIIEEQKNLSELIKGIVEPVNSIKKTP